MRAGVPSEAGKRGPRPPGSGGRGIQGRDWVALLIAVAICLAVSALGGWATSTSVGTWYPTLAKPSFNPPDAVFAPVWTTLYLMMGVAAWLIWRQRCADPAAIRRALALFGVQLALNLAWSVLFFGLRQIGWALVDIVLLWTAIAAATLAFWRVDRTAGLLMLPYLAWVGFAGMLNLVIWRLN